jgi:hypothetical protein
MNRRQLLIGAGASVVGSVGGIPLPINMGATAAEIVVGYNIKEDYDNLLYSFNQNGKMYRRYQNKRFIHDMVRTWNEETQSYSIPTFSRNLRTELFGKPWWEMQLPGQPSIRVNDAQVEYELNDWNFTLMNRYAI